MRRATTALFLATLAGSLLASPPAHAQTCPADGAVDWGNVTETAESIWSEAAARAHEARLSGARQAEEAVRGRARALLGSVSGEFDTQGRSELNEYIADAALTIQLGQLQSKQRERFDSEQRALQVEAQADKWSYVFGVQEAFVAWRSAEYEREHLEEYYREAEAALEPIREASERDLVSEIDLADIEAETARIAAELSRARRKAAYARANVQAAIGRDCELADVEVDEGHLDDLPSPAGSENPWDGPIASVEKMPAVEAMRARADAMRAESRAQQASDPVELSVGAGVRSVGLQDHFMIGTLGITLPLARPGRSAAALRSGEARATSARANWLVEQVRAQLRARSERYDALVASYRSNSDELLTTMRERVELMESALKGGHIAVDRLIRARRDLHEAYHHLLNLHTQIQAHQLRARALQQWLEAQESRP